MIRVEENIGHGTWVKIKPYSELRDKGWFVDEMKPYCGKTFEVHRDIGNGFVWLYGTKDFQWGVDGLEIPQTGKYHLVVYFKREYNPFDLRMVDPEEAKKYKREEWFNNKSTAIKAFNSYKNRGSINGAYLYAVNSDGSEDEIANSDKPKRRW